MNELSWILYLADVAGKLGPALEVACGVGGLVAVAFGIFGTIGVAEKMYTKASYGSLLGFIIGFSLLTGLFSTLIPSKDTVYAIAVSEVGEEVYKSEVGQKATEALKAWLDKQIADAKGTGK